MRIKKLPRQFVGSRAVQTLLACVLVVVSLSTIWSPTYAATQSTPVRYRVLESEPLLSADGRELGREVRCACYSESDRITVWRIDGNTPISPDLDQESDFDGTLWLFYVGNLGGPQLAVRFHRVDQQLTADVYDDQTGDGRVSVTGGGRETSVTESEFWSLRMVALDGYWQQAGRPALNFDLTVDGRINATFGSELYANAMKNDGQPDVVIAIRGPANGDPRSFDWRNVYTPFSTTSNIYRTTLMVRERGEEPAYEAIFPWYVMGATAGPTHEDSRPIDGVLWEDTSEGLVKATGRSSAPIQVDWGLGKIIYVAEFVASRGSDNNWFTYSIKRIEPDTLTNPNFESPFAFYDLANDHDNLPELAIRAVRFDDDAPASDAPPNGSEGLQMIRYSWDQGNDTKWSYKLAVLGRQSVDSRVVFPDFELQTIPYADLPTWVTRNSWDVVTFVAAEHPVWTSEGLYDWDFIRPATNLYSGAGPIPRDVNSAFTTLADGMRGDYSFRYGSVPELTLNPIDGVLHLARAEGGIWNLPGGAEVRYLNLAQGDAIDGWQYWENQRLVSQLYWIPGGLIYSDQEQTLFLEVDIPKDLFHTSPPTNHVEWVELGNKLADDQKAFDPGDLRAMFDQFDGTPVQVTSSPLSEFHLIEGGVQFIVDASDEASRESLAALAGEDLGTDFHVVSRVDNKWSVDSARFASPSFSVDFGEIEALDETTIRVTVVNPGSTEIDAAALDVTAVFANGARIQLLTGEPVEVNGAGQQVFDIEWAARLSGRWTLEIALRRPASSEWSNDPVVLAQATQPFEVLPQERLAVSTAASLGWPGVLPQRLILLVGLAGLAALIAIVGFVRQRRTA